MKRIYLILIVLVGISVSCTKNFEDWQKDTKHPSEVPGDMLFTNAQKALTDQVSETNVNLNNFKLWAQYWTETTYTDEANYDLINRNIPDNVYRVFYTGVLKDLREAKMLIAEEAPVTEEGRVAQANRILIAEIIEVYVWQRLVDIFGNIPYSEALDIDATLNPSYDDAFTIYKDLFTRLDAAMDALNQGGGSFGDADVVYQGDVAAWYAFANSLKVRMAVTIADADDAYARAKYTDANADAFSSNADNAEVVYDAAPLASTNPLYQSLVASGRNDYVAANTMIDYLKELEDPRIDVYYDKHDLEEHIGGDYGYTSAFYSYSHVGAAMHEPTFPGTLLSYVELEWYRAEAASRGWGGEAKTHYDNAIRASFDWWGVAGVDDYLAKPEVDFAQASVSEGSEMNAIAKQAYLGLYERGFEAWTTLRRLDYPVMNVPEGAITTDGLTPRRFTYPVKEQTLNEDNYYKAAEAIGGDFMETKLFWDKN
jgi:hypothetical protein